MTDAREWYASPFNADLPHGTRDPKALLPPPNHLACAECRAAILALVHGRDAAHPNGGPRMKTMACWKCHTVQSRRVKKCRVCSSVAFYSGRRMPAWPPIFSGLYVDHDGDERPNQQYGAFLEGDIPHGPELNRLASPHARQFAKPAGIIRSVPL